jgi:hypothetical protein
MAYVESTGRFAQTIGTSSSVVLKQQITGRRVLFSITNTSSGTEKVYLAFGTEAKLGQGIVLSPGGYYIESIDNNFQPTMDEIQAISDQLTATVAVTIRTGNNDGYN